MNPAGMSHSAIVEPPAGLGLEPQDFRQVAARGFEDPQNNYAHSMAWFKGCLYVGTSRNSLWLIKRRGKVAPPPEMECWPVQFPDPMPMEQMCAEIWRYEPRRDEWKRVYKAPLVDRDGMPFPRDLGYRGMVAFQGRSDPEPALYTAGISGAGLNLMRSVDGEHWEDIGEPGLGDPRMVSARSMLEWRGKLYVTPVGAMGKTPNETDVPVILESDDPVNGEWRQVCIPGFGDDTNKAVADMAVFEDHLYAATLNPTCGFQLYKTRARGEPPYDWTRVLSAGAYRGYLNEGIAHMCVFKGALYLGTGIAGGGYNRWHQIGPAAAEVIRVHADDTWDLIVGMPRLTPNGLKPPLSGLGPGFNFPLNGYVWRVCEHEGWLYVGTYNASVFLPFKPIPIPEEILKLLKLSDSEEFQARYGGCHLWRSPDGERFLPVTTNGFGTTYNHGIRQLCSTPHGLFVGTSNPFGPNVGVKRDGEWRYEGNPRGGLEIWLGDRSNRRSAPGARGKSLRLAAPRRETAVTDHRETLASLASLFRVLVYTRVTEDFYEQSGYTQMGYWRPGTAGGREACDNLMDELLGLVGDKGGRILEIECGQGSTTEALLRHYAEDRITGVDPFPLALDIARARMPRATFEIMSPTMLHFPDDSFRSILCVERACYFNTRREFLREAFRVLEPGGRLVLSDILYSRTGEALSIDRHRQNYLSGPRAYAKLLEKEGYRDVQVIDATRECAQAYLGAVRRHYIGRFMQRKTTEGDFNTLMGLISLHALFLRHYVLVGATKPLRGEN